MSLSAIRQQVRRLVRDAGGVLEDPDYDYVAGEALRRYSRVRPRVLVEELPGDGSWEYALPASYAEGFSRIEHVEYPGAKREAEIVDRLDWRLVQTPAGLRLRFLRDVPAVGLTIWLTYTAPHTADEAGTTVPDAELDAVHLVAAALACEQLASHYSNASDPTILADSVDHKSKAAEYALRAKRFMQLANELLPVKEQGETRPAGGETSLGQEMPWLLTHPNR
jgi:hypothetical protein